MIWGEEGWGIYSGGCLAWAEQTGRTGRADVTDDACTERTGGQALTKRSGGRADERTGQKGCGRSGGRGRKVERSGGRADKAVGADGAQTAGRADGRMGGGAGGPGFKRSHSTRPTSLLGT